MSNIYLVGFMCSGKSTVGKLLAKELNLKFIDVDTLIEEETGQKISDIFKQKGEKYFRELEKEKIHQLSKRQGLVVSTGGGLGADFENMNLMKKTGTVVWLKVPFDTVIERCGDDKSRPMLNMSKEKLKNLFKEREEVYKLADFSIDTEGKTPEEILNQIKVLLKIAGAI